MAADRKYIYGPVPSRRLGRSLGIDLVPFKTCTYDCVYCQLGRTSHKSMHRRAYLPAHEILAELEHVLSENKKIYYKTGEGEPSG
jgi:wyosine [tRNA(Phe)-imidazoG37] synthetase (radical SAM superfamily)